MKKVTRYEIRSYTGNEYSKAMSRKLRDRTSATRLVKRLKKMGHQAFAAKVQIFA